MSQPERGFRALPHTADKAVEVWAPTLTELFRTAAEAMFAESVECGRIPREREWDLEVEGESLEELPRSWLSELLWVSERDEAVPCEFSVAQIERQQPLRLRGRARGGPAPADSPHTGAPVKAVTYHGLRVWREGERWRAQIVFDV